MQAILIHPADLEKFINYSVPLSDLPGHGFVLKKAEHPPMDDLIEIGGRLYYQTIRAPRFSES